MPGGHTPERDARRARRVGGCGTFGTCTGDRGRGATPFGIPFWHTLLAYPGSGPLSPIAHASHLVDAHVHTDIRSHATGPWVCARTPQTGHRTHRPKGREHCDLHAYWVVRAIQLGCALRV
eukprot:2515736-Prymnesium_polylepis.1